MNIPGARINDVVVAETTTLRLWIRRPTESHMHWWLCYYSTDAREARVWDGAICSVARERGLAPFHQGCWPDYRATCHSQCEAPDHYQCPGMTQAWEMWVKCSDWALHFPNDPIADIRACGDEALAKLEAAIPHIAEKAGLLVA